ncbi:MAG: HAD-IIIA family hydrolase [Pseudomonadota bacterium]
MKLVVLGRDGVINLINEDEPVRRDSWKPVPGSIAAITRLNQAGYRVVVATNQQALSLGQLGVEELHDVHEMMLREVQESGGSIEGIFFAAKGNPDGHGKRQPKVNLLRQIEQRYHVPSTAITVVGDSREDLEAAKAVGARALLVQTGDGAHALSDLNHFDGVTIFRDLAAAAEQLCREAANTPHG